MRRATLAFLAVCAVGVAALVVAGATKTTTLAYTLGVANQAPIIAIGPGHIACQRPVSVPAGGEFSRVRVSLGTYFKPGPQLLVTIRDPRGQVLATGTLPGGYPDLAEAPSHVVDLGRTVTGRRLAVCFRNVGTRQVAVYGGGAAAHRLSTAFVDGKAVDADMNIRFERPPRSYLSQAGRIAERAGTFRGPHVSELVYALLLLVLLAGGVAGVAVALARIDNDSAD